MGGNIAAEALNNEQEMNAQTKATHKKKYNSSGK